MSSASDTSAPPAPRPYFSRAGLTLGARMALPIAMPTVIFGMAFGTVAVQKGLSAGEATLMSAAIIAGASQFVAVEMWAHPMTIATLVAVAVVAAVVNARFFLMSAALHPSLGTERKRITWPALVMMTDPGWLMTMRYHAEGGRDSGFLLGSGIVMASFWVLSTLAGALLGGFISDPQSFGIDLVLPCFFVVMLIPLWRGVKKAIPWAVAGLVAMLVSIVVDGSWYLIAGSLAGAITAGFLPDD